MADARIGYYNTGASPAYGSIAADTQIAYVPDPIGNTALIFYEMGARIGRSGSTAGLTRFGIGNVNDGGDPSSLLGYTTYFQPTTQMVSGAGGAAIVRDLFTPVLGRSKTAYALAMTSANQPLGFGAILKANYAGRVNYDYYTRANASSAFTDPIGGSVPTPGNEFGHIALWATGEINVAPNKPTGITPSGTIVSTDTTPVITANFSDDNENLPNGKTFDKLDWVRVQVRRKSDQVSFWGFSYEPTDAEILARQSSIEYAGSALSAGVTYQVRVSHRDIAGAWSEYSDWTDFTINAGGTVTAATPTGKQNSTTPGPFVGGWQHPNPLNADRVIVRIEDGQGNIVQTMSKSSPFTLSPTVASGENISIAWADTGFTALTRGRAYYFRMMARDTGTAWGNSDQWSNRIGFTINATPGVPVLYSPANAKTFGFSPPLIEVVASDKDDVTSTLTVTVEFVRHDGTTVQRTMSYNATTGRFEYTPVAGTDERQLITRSGTISGGSFTIQVPANFKGGPFTTVGINWNDNAATIEGKIEALANVGAGNVMVTGGPVSTTNVTINFRNELGGKDLGQIVLNSSLTGGGSITPSTTVAGVAQDYVSTSLSDTAWNQALQWRARASDGVSTSDWSSYRAMTISQAPSVTLTSPTNGSTVTTATHRVTWTVNLGVQAKYRVVVEAVDAFGSPIVPTPYFLDTGDIVSTNTYHDIANLRNGLDYLIFVEVVDAAGLRGVGGTPYQFSVAFTPPEAITNFVAGPKALQASTGDDAMGLNWTASQRPNTTFRYYELYRQTLTEEGVRSPLTLLRRIYEIAQTSFVDPFPIPGVVNEYTLYQTILIGLDEVTSLPAVANGSIDVDHVVLKSVKEPETYGVELRYKSGTAGFMVSRRTNDARKVRPVSGSVGRTIKSSYRAWEDSGTFEIVTDRFQTAAQVLARFEALDVNADTVCIQDFTGVRRFVTIDELQLTRFGTERAQLTIKVSEEYYVEGETT